MATIRVCVDCAYFAATALLSRGECRRYPVTQMKSESEWCGEFMSKSASVPVVPIEPSVLSYRPKSKRLREAQSIAASVSARTPSWDANGSPTND